MVTLLETRRQIGRQGAG